jgi:Phosphopantetheine attachment site/AMP-binding enzyme C-terminal domain
VADRRTCATRAGVFRNDGQEGKRLMSSAQIQEVEAALAGHPGLANVAVVEHSTELGDQCLVAYVSPDSHGLDVPGLHTRARKVLPGDRMPAAIVVLEELPVSVDGIVDHNALPAPELDGLMPYLPPATARQEALCVLFAEALGLPRCGISQNFLSLGGRSLEAMLLVARINAALGVRISIGDLLDAPTVGELDRRLDR